MSGINRRTVLCGQVKDVLVNHDWAICTTDLGTMIEPKSQIFARRTWDVPVTTYDPTDMICRIDEVEKLPFGQEQLVFAFGGPTVLHGGSMYPRTGF